MTSGTRVAVALLVGALGILVAVAGFQWLNRQAATELGAADVPGTVILIPGYGGGDGGLTGMAQYLTTQGRPVIIADIGDGRGDISGYGSQVAGLAASLVAQGAPSVDLVGYSMGGLVARAAAAAAPDDIRRVATVSSPHGGTSVAALGAYIGNAASCPTACEQMAPGSAFLDSLPVAADSSRWLSAWTSDDDVVRPADSGSLPGATSIEIMSACGTGPLDHGAVVRSAATWELVSTFLATGQVSSSCNG